VCSKFYPDRLRFGSTRAKNLFWSKNTERPSMGLSVNNNNIAGEMLWHCCLGDRKGKLRLSVSSCCCIGDRRDETNQRSNGGWCVELLLPTSGPGADCRLDWYAVLTGRDTGTRLRTALAADWTDIVGNDSRTSLLSGKTRWLPARPTGAVLVQNYLCSSLSYYFFFYTLGRYIPNGFGKKIEKN